MNQIINIRDEYYKKYLRVVPFRLLKDGKTFIEIEGHDKIMMLTITLSKASDIVEQDGTNVKNPKDGSPISRYVPKLKMDFVTRDVYERHIQ